MPALALTAALAALALSGVAVLDGGNDQAAVLPASGGGKLAPSQIGRVYQSAGPGVVSVQVGSASGTGFVVRSDGTIVTNAHVVGSARTAQVRFGDTGRQVEAEVRGTDPSSDLAVLHVDPGSSGPLRPLPLANSDEVSVGDSVVAIGHPFGLDRTATAGIVSGLGREIQAPDGFQIDKVIQTDAPINPGNSGGPLLDARGRVVGVNSQIATGGAGNGSVGIGFAIPSNKVREVLPALSQGQHVDHAYLGVSTAPSARGAEIQSVTAGSPAQSAGLRGGDVIVGFDGHQVTEPQDVSTAVNALKPGDRVQVEVLRDGQRHTVAVDLATRPTP
ncbi:MAG: hypothetical protein QOK00_1391 [Thermoleophilaceae bacterium]|nr:hypothetical protein [Thermoleophilaceae bacterium]